MFTFSRKENFITGTINGEVFGVNYSKETYDKMVELEEALENASTPTEAKEITEDFKKLTEENPKSQTTVDFHQDIFVANTGKFYLKVDSKITSVAMPEALVDRIKDSTDKGIDVSPLIKFWIRFLRNHKLRNICKTQEEKEAFANRLFNYVNAAYTDEAYVNKLIDEKGYSEEVARSLASVRQVQITVEGILKTYKVSEEVTKRFRLNEKGEREQYDVYDSKVVGVDEITGLLKYEDKKELLNEERVFRPAVMRDTGEEFFCGDNLGHIIKVGQTMRLKRGWDSIDTRDNVSCVAGAHSGQLDYIRGYQHSNTTTHNVLVCPSMIGAVTDDGSGAIRVVEMFILDAFNGTNGSIYHSSKYGSKLDEQWDLEKKEILKEWGELKDKKETEINSLV